MQWRLVRLSYGRSGATIITWYMQRPNTAFISAQPVIPLCIIYIYSRVQFSHMFVFFFVMTVITKSDFLWPKFIISFFSERVNCEKFMSCKYFTLFLSIFILTVQLLKSKHWQARLGKQLGKNGHKIPAFETLGKVHIQTNASFQPSQL